MLILSNANDKIKGWVSIENLFILCIRLKGLVGDFGEKQQTKKGII